MNEKDLLKNILDINDYNNLHEYLEKIIQNLAIYLDVKYAFIGHPINEQLLMSVQTDIVWADGNMADNFLYHLKDTPCEIVLTGSKVCLYQSNVCAAFPQDILLQEMGIESYMGTPLINNDKVEYILVLLDDKVIEQTELFKDIIHQVAEHIENVLKNSTERF